MTGWSAIRFVCPGTWVLLSLACGHIIAVVAEPEYWEVAWCRTCRGYEEFTAAGKVTVR